MSEVKNEIQVFLDKEYDDDQQQFSDGLVLFVKYSRNRNLQNHITRRGIREHSRLMLNLKQLAMRDNIQPSKVVGKKVNPNIRKEIDKGVTDTAALPHVEGVSHIDPAQLSAELLVVFNNGKNHVKLAQQFHMKMKDTAIATAERAEYRTEMLKANKAANEAFKQCSDFIKAMNAKGERVSQEPTKVELSAKEVSAIRKYVSEKLMKWDGFQGAAKSNVLGALNLRIAKMQGAGENFAPETVQKLKDIGVYFGE